MTKAMISIPRQHLVELMQQINFGKIEGLQICGGEPILDPRPRITRNIKFGCDNLPRPELDHRDFLLKTEVRQLFTCLDEVWDGILARIDIRHGLPFQLDVEASK